MRHQNEAEMGAAMARAETLVLAEIASALTHTSLEATLETLALRLPVIEPVEIEVVDPAGRAVSRTGSPDPSDDVDFPEWYGILVSPGEPHRVLPLEVAGRKIGEVRLVGLPKEILRTDGTIWSSWQC